MSDKFLLFTWQPTWVLINGPACKFNGVPNVGELTHDDEKKHMVMTVTEGAVLKHDRQWELLKVRSLAGGNIVLKTVNPIDDTEDVLTTVADGATEEVKRIFGAGEEVRIFADSAPSGVMLLVREYESGRRGA